jgi:hypothetical protein
MQHEPFEIESLAFLSEVIRIDPFLAKHCLNFYAATVEDEGNLGERRRTKVIPHAFGEKPFLKLLYASLIRASQSWRQSPSLTSSSSKSLSTVYN